MRSGSVAIVGRTNVGKSTLLNALLGEPLAIVSPLPQTTRDTLLGVLHLEDAQIAFQDTPGLHRPRHELGRRINHAALESLRAADAILYVTDVASRAPAKRTTVSVHPDDERLIKMLPSEVPVILVINKVDLFRDKTRLLPLTEAFGKLFEFKAFIPISALKANGLERVLSELESVLPEAEATHAPDTLTDRPLQFFVREYVREQVMLHCYREVPHAVAVTIDSFKQTERRSEILATIHVEKDGQRGVIIGKGGSLLKQIGTEARARLEELIGTPVYLELFVRVTERWKNVPRQLAELGYESGGARSLSGVFGASKTKPRSQRPQRKSKGAVRQRAVGEAARTTPGARQTQSAQNETQAQAQESQRKRPQKKTRTTTKAQSPNKPARAGAGRGSTKSGAQKQTAKGDAAKKGAVRTGTARQGSTSGARAAARGTGAGAARKGPRKRRRPGEVRRSS